MDRSLNEYDLECAETAFRAVIRGDTLTAHGFLKLMSRQGRTNLVVHTENLNWLATHVERGRLSD